MHRASTPRIQQPAILLARSVNDSLHEVPDQLKDPDHFESSEVPFAPTDPNATVAHNQRMITDYVRHPRAPNGDRLDGFVKHMEALARVANGATLVHGLVKGSIKGNDVIAELLRMGTLTPEKVIGMKDGDVDELLKPLIDVIGMNGTPKLIEIEDNMLAISAMMNSNFDLANIQKKQADFQAAWGSVNTTTIDVKQSAKTTGDLIEKLQIANNTLPTASPSDIVHALDFINLQSVAFEKVKLDLIKVFIVNLRKFTKQSSFVQNLIDDVNLKQKVKNMNFDKDLVAKVQQNLQTFSACLETLSTLHILNHLKSFVDTRELHKPPFVIHISGFAQGRKDLNSLPMDTRGPWIKDRTNGTKTSLEHLGVALKSLDELGLKMDDAEKMWKPQDDKIDSTKKILSLELELVGQSGSSKQALVAADKLNGCQRSHIPSPLSVAGMISAKQAIDNFNEKVRQISDLDYVEDLKNLQKWRDAVTFTSNVKDQKEKEGPGKLEAFKKMNVNELVATLAKLRTDLNLIDEILMNFTTTSAQIDEILRGATAYPSKVNDNLGKLLTCLKVVENSNFVTDMINSIREIRKLKGSSDLDQTKDFLNAVKSSSNALQGALKEAGYMKNQTMPEIKMLSAFPEEKPAQDLGKAVQGLAMIQKISLDRTKLASLTGDFKPIVDAATKQKSMLSSDDHAALIGLDSLKTALETMFTEIDAVTAEVQKLEETNLKSNGIVFSTASKIKSVTVDTKKLIKAVEALKKLDPSLTQQLDSITNALATIDKDLDLDFTKYNFAAAPAALQDLDLYFANWNRQVAIATATTPSPGGTNSRGGVSSGQIGAVSLSGKSDDFKLGFMEIAGICACIVSFVVLVIACIYGCVAYRRNSATEDEEDKQILLRMERKTADEQALELKEVEDRKKQEEDRKRVEDLVNAEKEKAAEVIKQAEEGKKKAEEDKKEVEKEREKERMKHEKEKAEGRIVERVKNREYMEALEESIPGWFWAADELVSMFQKSGNSKLLTPLGVCVEWTVFADEFSSVDHYKPNEDQKKKMRYTGLHCIPGSAVELKKKEGDKNKPYINANQIVIDGVIWIMSQAPLGGFEQLGKKDNTEEDHWDMINQKGVGLIYQLCNFKEKDKDGDLIDKCSEYYPIKAGGTKEIGKYKLTTIKIQDNLKDFTFDKEHFSVATVECVGPEGKKTVDILRYFGWKDHGVPKSELPILEMLKFGGKAEYVGRTRLVHCSAGIGRTGTFVGVEMATEMCTKMEKGGKPGVRAILTRLREHRSKAVQTAEQLMYMMLTLTKKLIIESDNFMFAPSYPAIRYFFNKMKDYPRSEYPEKEGEDKKDEGNKKDKKKKEKKEKKPKTSLYLNAEECEADRTSGTTAVKETEKKWNAKYAGKWQAKKAKMIELLNQADAKDREHLNKKEDKPLAEDVTQAANVDKKEAEKDAAGLTKKENNEPILKAAGKTEEKEEPDMKTALPEVVRKKGEWRVKDKKEEDARKAEMATIKYKILKCIKIREKKEFV